MKLSSIPNSTHSAVDLLIIPFQLVAGNNFQCKMLTIIFWTISSINPQTNDKINDPMFTISNRYIKFKHFLIHTSNFEVLYNNTESF